jgi:hypothetical protein
MLCYWQNRLLCYCKQDGMAPIKKPRRVKHRGPTNRPILHHRLKFCRPNQQVPGAFWRTSNSGGYSTWKSKYVEFVTILNASGWFFRIKTLRQILKVPSSRSNLTSDSMHCATVAEVWGQDRRSDLRSSAASFYAFITLYCRFFVFVIFPNALSLSTYETIPESKDTSRVGRYGNLLCLLWQHWRRPWSFTC